LANGSGKPSKGPGRFPPPPCISLSNLSSLIWTGKATNSSAYSLLFALLTHTATELKTFYVTRKDLHWISQTTKGLICYPLLHRKTQIHGHRARVHKRLRIRPSATAHWNTSECENAPANTADDGEFHDYGTMRQTANSTNSVQYDHLIIYLYYTIRIAEKYTNTILIYKRVLNRLGCRCAEKNVIGQWNCCIWVVWIFFFLTEKNCGICYNMAYCVRFHKYGTIRARQQIPGILCKKYE
jgi:hypothetical protein